MNDWPAGPQGVSKKEGVLFRRQNKVIREMVADYAKKQGLTVYENGKYFNPERSRMARFDQVVRRSPLWFMIWDTSYGQINIKKI